MLIYTFLVIVLIIRNLLWNSEYTYDVSIICVYIVRVTQISSVSNPLELGKFPSNIIGNVQFNRYNKPPNMKLKLQTVEFHYRYSWIKASKVLYFKEYYFKPISSTFFSSEYVKSVQTSPDEHFLINVIVHC